MTNATHDRLPRLSDDVADTCPEAQLALIEEITSSGFALSNLIRDRVFTKGVIAQLHGPQYAEILHGAAERYILALAALDFVEGDVTEAAPTISELSQAFAPCDTQGLADAWVQCNRDIADANRTIEAARKERKPIEQSLLALMLKAEGEVIEGEGYVLRLVWGWEQYDFQRRTAVRVPSLELEWT